MRPKCLAIDGTNGGREWRKGRVDKSSSTSRVVAYKGYAPLQRYAWCKPYSYGHPNLCV
jgi:hypothetical protein